MALQPPDHVAPGQHFPTYKFKAGEGRDIVLAEYQSASQILAAEEKIFTLAGSLVMVIISVSTTFFIGDYTSVVENLQSISHRVSLLLIAFCFLMLATDTLVVYLTSRIRAVVYAARKIVVLRGMLDLDYGRTHMVLPNWRVDGANEPFSIQVFPGWMSFPTLAVTALAAFSAAVVVIVLNQVFPIIFVAPFVVLYVLNILLLYRVSLFDFHENLYLSFARILSNIMRVRLFKNFEYIIYRSKLSAVELKRVNVNGDKIADFFIQLEDRTFYKHIGISARGIAGAIKRRLFEKRFGGGSTITQQLARSLFIPDSKSLLRRKIIEVILAFWLESIFSKKQILDMYVEGVRYDHGVIGLSQAIRHYFGALKQPTISQSFFLAERVSNIRSTLLFTKVRDNIIHNYKCSLLNKKDVSEVLDIYESQRALGNIHFDENKFLCLKNAICKSLA